MKKLIVLAVTCCLFLISLSIAGAETTNVEVFTHEQLATSQGLIGLNPREIVMLGDTLYAYLDNASVYSWRISEPAPRLFCQLPVLPESTSTAYSNLTSKAKTQWDHSVNFLATGEDALWGVNVFTGKVGEITQEGVQWHEVKLDVTRLMPDGHPWPLRVVNAFVRNHMLYTYVAMDDGAYPQNNYEMLAFDLTSGSCSVLDIQNAQGICAYKPGSVLLLHPADESTWTIKVMDLSTGTISDSSFHPFPSASDKPIGGLAFDPISDRLFFTAKGQVWRAAQGQEYVPVAFVPALDIVGETIGFALEDGRYALFFNFLYVRGVEIVSQTPVILHIQGGMDDAIYESFSSENPNIPVDFIYEFLSPDEIVQSLITSNQTADLYTTMADHTFSAIVKKGYAADLSSSAVLSSDIQSMYPNIQRVITDQAGNPIAYPYNLQLGHWQVNEAAWRHIYGDVALPATYDQFMDAMVLWESTYADEYPGFNFSMNFDHAYWVRTIVNAFAQQYGQPNSPLVLNSPILRGVLEKLEQARDIRKNNGRSIHFLEDSEFMPKSDLFITSGFNNVLLDPINAENLAQAEFTENIEEAIYSNMPALVFLEGEQPCVPGKMIVWFVNPFSQHKELAIQYLEHATQMKNNSRTYYATHPNANEPLAYEGFEQSVQEMKNRRDDLNEALKVAEGVERADIEENLIYAEDWFSNQEKNKWALSEEAIANYRAFAPSISFFEDNPYITPDGSRMLQQLEGLYERYASGFANLDAFLKELEDKMRTLYLEGK